LRARATCSSLVRLFARANPPRLPRATARGSFLRFSLDTVFFLAIPARYYPPSMTVNRRFGRFVLCAFYATRLAFLLNLRGTMSDQHDRNLRTFFNWTIVTGLLVNDPVSRGRESCCHSSDGLHEDVNRVLADRRIHSNSPRLSKYVSSPVGGLFRSVIGRLAARCLVTAEGGSRNAPNGGKERPDHLRGGSRLFHLAPIHT